MGVRRGVLRHGDVDALGTVDAIVKLGSFHGYDDPYYVDRYGPKLWAPASMKHDKINAMVRGAFGEG